PRTSVTLTRDVTTTGATTPRVDRSRSRVEGGSSELPHRSPHAGHRRASSGPLHTRTWGGSRRDPPRARLGDRLEVQPRHSDRSHWDADRRSSRIRERRRRARRGLRSTSNVDSIDRRSRVDRDDLKKNFFSGGGGGEITKSFSERSRDRKSTRLNSSHVSISYAVFCLNKKIDRTCYTLYNPLHR